ncbi:MAG: MBL fold metallo-hydrolase [Haloferacaceae archaeon]
MAHELGSSDWGDWLPRAVEDADPDGVAIWYLGCNGFVLKGSAGTTVFVDPYLGLGDPPRTVRMVPVPFDPTDVAAADGVLATHEHSDHVHGATQGPILAATGADYLAPDESIAVTQAELWIDQWDIDVDQFREVAGGDALEIGEFTIHVESTNDPDADRSVGYVFEHEAGTFFHGGDARPGSEFEAIGDRYDIDLGVLAFGTSGMIRDKQTREPTYTKWYSDENEIVEAAGQLELDRLLPSHWDIWKGLTADPTALHEHARSFEYPERLEIVEIGDRVDL